MDRKWNKTSVLTFKICEFIRKEPLMNCPIERLNSKRNFCSVGYMLTAYHCLLHSNVRIVQLYNCTIPQQWSNKFRVRYWLAKTQSTNPAWLLLEIQCLDFSLFCCCRFATEQVGIPCLIPWTLRCKVVALKFIIYFASLSLYIYVCVCTVIFLRVAVI